MAATPERNADWTRFADVELGDGREYRCALAGVGGRGATVLALADAFSRSTVGVERMAYAAELARVCLSPFYSVDTIERLIRDGAITDACVRVMVSMACVETMAQIVKALTGGAMPDMGEDAPDADGETPGVHLARAAVGLYGDTEPEDLEAEGAG